MNLILFKEMFINIFLFYKVCNTLEILRTCQFINLNFLKNMFIDTAFFIYITFRIFHFVNKT